MVSFGGKDLLRNIIKHTDAHNKIAEEAEMWSKWEKNKRTEKGSSLHKTDREGIQDSSTYIDNGSTSTFWMRQLAKVEEADPDRWGHSGFKELYPEKFESDDDKSKPKKMKKKKKKKHKKKKYESDSDTNSSETTIEKNMEIKHCSVPNKRNKLKDENKLHKQSQTSEDKNNKRKKTKRKHSKCDKESDSKTYKRRKKRLECE